MMVWWTNAMTPFLAVHPFDRPPMPTPRTLGRLALCILRASADQMAECLMEAETRGAMSMWGEEEWPCRGCSLWNCPDFQNHLTLTRSATPSWLCFDPNIPYAATREHGRLRITWNSPGPVEALLNGLPVYDVC
jgi:hypothetical protein